jgi:hypothetical protein
MLREDVMATITWNNSNGGNWNTASDWTPNQVPGAGDDAEIDASGTYTVTITSSVAVKSLTTVSGATVAISNGDSLAWTTGSTITNNGMIALNSTGTGTMISLNGTNGGTITLDGSGALVLGNNANNSIEADGFSLTLNNNSTIEGSGAIGTNVNLALNNTGTINANQSTSLILQPSLNNSSPTVNTGTLEATSGGTLQLQGIITNTDGLIQATGVSSVVSLMNGVSVTDGTLTSSNGGVIQSVSGTLSGAPTITTGSTVSVPDGDSLTWTTGSTITNNGTIALNSAGTGTKISLNGGNGGTITLDGSGVLVLGNNANNSIEADQFSLTLNNNSTIEGSGAIGTNVNLALNNAGTINANQSTPLVLQPSLNNSSPTVNTGTLEATSGGTLQLQGIITNTTGTILATGMGSMVLLDAVVTNGGTFEATNGGLLDATNASLTNLSGTALTGGTYNVGAAGTVQLANNTTIVTDIATIILNGAGSGIQSLNTTSNAEVTLDSTLTTIGAGGALELLGGRSFTTSAAFRNAGMLDLAGGVFTAAALTDTSSATLSGYGTVANLFTGAGTVNASGGTLAFTGAGDSFTGALNGAGTLAFAGGSDALNSGATLTTAAVTITGTATNVSANENLSYAGTLTDGAGTDLTIGSGDILTLTGNDSIAGTIGGAGTLVLGGGDTLASGASITVSNWTISGSGTAVTLAENLTYAGVLTNGAGTDLIIGSGYTLTLAGTASGGGTITFGTGGGTLKLAKATTLGEALSGFNIASAIDIASLTYKASYFAAWAATSPTSGTLMIEDSANNNNVVASFTLTNVSYANFSISNDGSNGTLVSLSNIPTADMIMRNGTNGDYEIYDIGYNAILGANALGQVGLEWKVAGLGGFYSTDSSDMILRDSNTWRVRGLRHQQQPDYRLPFDGPSRLGMDGCRLRRFQRQSKRNRHAHAQQQYRRLRGLRHQQQLDHVGRLHGCGRLGVDGCRLRRFQRQCQRNRHADAQQQHRRLRAIRHQQQRDHVGRLDGPGWAGMAGRRYRR